MCQLLGSVIRVQSDYFYCCLFFIANIKSTLNPAVITFEKGCVIIVIILHIPIDKPRKGGGGGFGTN